MDMTSLIFRGLLAPAPPARGMMPLDPHQGRAALRPGPSRAGNPNRAGGPDEGVRGGSFPPAGYGAAPRHREYA